MRTGRMFTALLLAAAAAALFVAPGAASATSAGALTGTFRITAGNCTGGAHGSYFRMINPTDTTGAGRYVSNASSGCTDQTYTLLSPGTDGGLATGGYQPAPSPGFDAKGNSLAARIIKPVGFFNVNFSASTEPTDLQTSNADPAPTFSVDASGALTGDVRAFDATWNNQKFNQGAPKPDGSTPGISAAPKGTLNLTTNKFTVEWLSQIVGGPFNNFTGLWHLEGTFVPAASSGGSAGGTTGGTKTALTTKTGATVTTTAAAGDATTTTAAPTGTQAAAPTTTVHKGWHAPAGIVIAIAALGVLAVLALLLLDQRGSSTEDVS